MDSGMSSSKLLLARNFPVPRRSSDLEEAAAEPSMEVVEPEKDLGKSGGRVADEEGKISVFLWW